MIVASSEDCIISKDLNGLITSWNQGAEKIFGYAAGEMLGTSIQRLIPADRLGEEIQILERIRRAENVDHFETVRQTKDGRLIHLSITASPIKTAVGEIIGVSKVGRDISARKRAEAALVELQRQQERILTAVGEGLHGIDRDGNIIFENPAAGTMLGWDVKGLIGQPAHRIMHHTRADGSDYPEAECPIYRTLRDGATRQVDEELFWRKNGTSFPVTYTCTPMRGPAGEIVGAVVAFRDITERKQAEAALRESEERFRAYVEQATDAMFVHDLSGRFLDMNRHACVSLGYSREELLNMTVCDVDQDFTLAQAQAAWHQIEPDQPLTLEGHHRRKNGTSFPVEVQFGCFDIKGKRHYMGLARDITQRKQTEAALQQSEENFRSMFEVASIGIAQTDPRTGRWLRVNPQLCAMTGYSAEEMLRLRVPEVTHPDDRHKDWEAFQRVIRCEVPSYQLEKRYVRKDGTVIWVNVNMTCIRDAAGQPIRTIASIEDITGRKRMEHIQAVRLRLSEFALTHSHDEFWQQTLDEAEALTGSQISFLHFVQPDGLTSYLETWSTNTQQVMQMAQRKGDRYHVSTAGIWADCLRQRRPIIHNDYACEPQRKGLPSGHAPVLRELTVPIIRGERVLAILGIGNKPQAYTPEDVEAVSGLAHFAWEVAERKRAEEALAVSEENYRLLFERMLDGFALHEIICDAAGQPVDYRFLSVNPAFERMTGLRAANVLGQTVLKVMPATEPSWIERYGRVAQTGEGLQFEEFSAALNRHFEVAVFCPKPGQFATLFIDITERKLAETQIRRLSVFPELNPNPVLEFAADGTLTYQNQASLSLSQSLGLAGVAELLPPRVAELVRQCLATDQPQLRVETASGGHIISSSFYPIRATNTVHCYMGDITERRQAETALRESQALYHSLVTQLPIGIFRKDSAGRFVFVNPSFCTLKGMPAADFLGKTPLEIVTGEGASRDTSGRATKYAGIGEEHHRLIMQTGQVITTDEEYVLDQRGTQFVHVMKFPVYGTNGTIVGSQGVQFNVTERKLAEAQVSLQLSALTAAANAIVITDREGNIKWVNPAFTKLTGYTAEEAIGGNPRVLKSGQHAPSFYATLWATVSAGNVWHGEMINKRKDGQLYTEEMTITPVQGTDGQIRHFVAVKQDITERRQLETRIQQAQKMEAIGTLAGGIAHDFNNILAALMGYANLLKQDTEGNSEAQESVDEILVAAERAKGLVKQILTFSRQREQKRETIRLDMVTKEAMKFLRASLPANIKIEMQLAVSAPAVLADPTQIYQVVLNLATNALHAMEGRSGQLTLRLDAFQPGQSFINTHPEFRPMPYARLTVADTGHGMDARTLARIFEPFFTTKPVGQGTGLGLSVVHGIVQSHEGIILVESEVGVGTSFCLFFPAQTLNAALTKGGTPEIPKGQGQTILLVDDEAALTGMFERLLKRLKYQVVVTNSPVAALRLVHETPSEFDLVITDLTMPDMTGLDLARQLRLVRADLPVILASGFTTNLNPQILAEAGVFALIEKPVSPIALAEAVQRALKKE